MFARGVSQLSTKWRMNLSAERVWGRQVEENGSCLKFEKYLGEPIKDHCHLLTTKALD